MAGYRGRVEVLRIGHRPGRDPRLTTHLALTARALGASAFHLHPPDPDVARQIEDVNRRFGGAFRIEGVREWRSFMKSWPGTSVHLTMYGEDLDDILPRAKLTPPVLLVTGGAKVPSELYQLAGYNVAVTHQPHSEVAALALTLDRLLGVPRGPAPEGAQIEILPSPRGKRVVEHR